MNTDNMISFGAALWDLATWRYFPIVILMLTPIVVHYLAHPFTVVDTVQRDPETGEKRTVKIANRRQALLLSGAAIAIPLQLWFMYLFLKITGV